MADFSELLHSVSPFITRAIDSVAGANDPGSPFPLSADPRIDRRILFHDNRPPQWRLRHTVTDHAQQYRNKRRIVHLTHHRIAPFRSPRHALIHFFSRGDSPRSRRLSPEPLVEYPRRGWTRWKVPLPGNGHTHLDFWRKQFIPRRDHSCRYSTCCTYAAADAYNGVQRSIPCNTRPR